MASGRAADRKTGIIQGATQRVVLIGTRSANSIRASGHAPHRRAGHMTAPDHIAKTDSKALARGGRSLIASPLSMAFCFLLLPYRGHGSLRGRKRPPQHLVRSTSAAMSTTGSHGVFMWPKALLRSRLHPRPVGQPLHPRRRFGCISVKHSLGGHRLLGPTEWLA